MVKWGSDRGCHVTHCQAFQVLLFTCWWYRMGTSFEGICRVRRQDIIDLSRPLNDSALYRWLQLKIHCFSSTEDKIIRLPSIESALRKEKALSSPTFPSGLFPPRGRDPLLEEVATLYGPPLGLELGSPSTAACGCGGKHLVLPYQASHANSRDTPIKALLPMKIECIDGKRL